jgi:hypothetical protein
MAKKRRPKSEDPNEVALRVVRQATGEKPAEVQPSLVPTKNPAAVELGRRGGRVGGRKRAENLSKDELSKIGKLGAAARWSKKS